MEFRIVKKVTKKLVSHSVKLHYKFHLLFFEFSGKIKNIHYFSKTQNLLKTVKYIQTLLQSNNVIQRDALRYLCVLNRLNKMSLAVSF